MRPGPRAGRLTASLVLAFLVAIVAPACRAGCAQDIVLPARATPGELVVGSAPAGTEVDVGKHVRTTGPDGIVVFGIGRDATIPVHVRFQCPDGQRVERTLDVAPRSWRIERVDGVPGQTVHPPPAIAERIALEQRRVAQARERDDARADFAQPFPLPVAGRRSGVYGSQRVLNGTPKDPHLALDIAAPEGTPVRAPAPGVVTLAEPSFYLTGGTVLLDHGHGVSTSYSHLSRIDVRVGQRIARGARLGAVGKTGRATGPHLHWGLNWFEVRLDPELRLDAKARGKLGD